MNNKLIITEYQNCIADFLFSDYNLEELYLFPKNEEIGNIYVAVIKNKIKNLNAAFVEYQEKKMAFLPLSKEEMNNLHEGETVLIQIEKSAVKTKDPVATTNLSLNSMFTVVSLKPSKELISYSKKLSSKKKEELINSFEKENKISDLLKNCQFSAVIRTSAEKIDKFDILTNELQLLIQKLKSILKDGEHRTPFSLLYENQDQYLKQLLKFSSTDYDEIITDQENIYHACCKVLPNSSIRLYKDTEYSLNKLYSIDSNMDKIKNKKVYLKSGGNIIIEHTEALTVIDVNTGKNIKKLKADDLAFETNLEAAEEISKQLILRNVSGIIIIDFINMDNTAYLEKLKNQIKNLCKKDKVQCNFIDFTQLGLAEITRKKISAPIYEII